MRVVAQKHWWKIALTMIAAGLALLILAFTFGARGGYAYIDERGIRIAPIDEYYTTHETDLPPFHAVEITAKSANIELIDSDHYGLEMQFPETANEPEWRIENGKLTIDATTADNFITFMSIGLIKSHYIKVYYPSGSNASTDERDNYLILSSVDLTVTSGNILLQGIPANSINLKTSSGRITADTPYYQSAEAHSNSGNITFTGTGIVSSLKLSTISGYVKADASGCDSVDAETKSGKITIFGSTHTTSELRAKTSSGNIGINVAAWESLTTENASGNTSITGNPGGTTSASARSGRVTMDLGGDEDEFSYDISTSSGTIRIGGQRVGSPATRINDSAGKTINIRVSSGNVKVDFHR